MTFSWHDLPEDIRARLLQSGVGMGHLYETAHEVFRALNHAEARRQPALFRLGCDMLLAAWESAPLEAAIASTLLTLHDRASFLPPELAGFIKFCSKQPRPDENLLRRFHPTAVGSLSAYERLLAGGVDEHPAAFFILARAVEHAYRENRHLWLRQTLLGMKNLPQPLRMGMLADTSFAEGQWDEAAAGYAGAHAALPLTLWETRRAESLYRAGRRDEAAALWRKARKRRPWQINSLLRLSDVLMGRDEGGPFPPGQGATLLYTWNKSRDIDATLASLAASELDAPEGGTRIVVLDNGSTDATPAVLSQWEARLAGRMRVVTLPVNIGAPAARNWLLALPETREAPWAAFLDDDVAVPKDWLRQLWSAIRAYPTAGVACGHALDYGAPMHQQWTDMHMVIKETPDMDNDDILQERFTFSSPHEQSFEFGDFSFMRPCVTAIGCCHMFTRAAMDEGGGFDICFSPSQSDDVDHDMRRVLAGRLPVYNGHLRVLHKRSTGCHSTRNPRARASALCNWFKLQGSYSMEEIRRIHALDQRTMWGDAQNRLALLGELSPSADGERKV